MNRNPSSSTGHRSPSNSLPLLTAITGFVNYKTAQGLSQRSVDSYKRILAQWASYAGNKKVAQFTDRDINAYLVYARIGVQWKVLNPPELVSELIIRLTLRANPLDIANEILVIEGTTLILCKHLRMQFTERCKQERRIRPFKNIAGGNSRNEDGFQLADMVAGAIRLYAMRISADRFHCVSQRIVDLWELY